MKQPATLHRSIAQILAANLTAALNVAGPQDDYGRPRKLNSAQLQRDTGIARSTLRALKNPSASQEHNPDLRTLCRIAKELRIPVALLLMSPDDWLSLLNAVVDLQQALAAANQVENDTGISGPQAALHILRLLKVYPLPAPVFAGEHDAQQREALDRKNDVHRRGTLVAAALAQTAANSQESRKRLTAMAAAYAHQFLSGSTSDL